MKYLNKILKLEKEIRLSQSLESLTSQEISQKIETIREILAYYDDALEKLEDLYSQCVDSLNPNDDEDNLCLDAHVIRYLSNGFFEASGDFWEKKDQYEAMLEEYEFAIADEIEEETT